jgi:hypothetical protein
VLPDANLPSDSDEEELEKPKEVSNKVLRSRYELKDGEEAMVENDQSILEELDQWYKVYLSRKKRDKNGVLLQES